MLNANELRIGNILTYSFITISGRHKKTCPVGSVTDRGVFLDEDFIELELVAPVLLTPEILEKCGFEKIDHDNKVFTYDADNIRIPVCLHWPGINNEASLTNVSHTEILSERFKYVHQLQNLFYALTGTELEVKL